MIMSMHTRLSLQTANLNAWSETQEYSLLRILHILYHIETLSLFPSLPTAGPTFIAENCNVIKMLNIPTNILNSATQILKQLWVLYGHAYANFMKIFVISIHQA